MGKVGTEVKHTPAPSKANQSTPTCSSGMTNAHPTVATRCQVPPTEITTYASLKLSACTQRGPLYAPEQLTWR